jgi:hypothetical protein
MTDPTFGEIEFHVQAWDGQVPFNHGPSGAKMFAVHVWADESGPTESQRTTFEQLKVRYSELWPLIAEALLGCHSDLDSVEAVERCLNPIVACHLEESASQGHEDFELVYSFDLDGEGHRGYFVRIVGWQVAEAFMAD